MATQVKAHRRNGKTVRSHTRKTTGTKASGKTFAKTSRKPGNVKKRTYDKISGAIYRLAKSYSNSSPSKRDPEVITTKRRASLSKRFNVIKRSARKSKVSHYNLQDSLEQTVFDQLGYIPVDFRDRRTHTVNIGSPRKYRRR